MRFRESSISIGVASAKPVFSRQPLMAIPKLSIPLRSIAVLAALSLWACSSSDGDDAKQTIDTSKSGSGAVVDDGSDAANGGSNGRPDDPEGTGDTGSVDEPAKGAGGSAAEEPGEPSAAAGAGGGQAEPEPEPEPEPGTDPEPEPEPTEPSEAFLRGKAFAELNQCVTCHQANFAGFTVFPNITPDVATGIGSWTDQQIVTAIVDGKDIDGKSLCASMARYPLSEDQAKDIVAFLRGLPAVSNRITSECPGHGS